MKRQSISSLTIVIITVAVSLADPASFQGLGDLPGGSFHSDAFGISADGSVVVGLSVSASNTEPFRWENGTMTSLGGFGNARNTSADGSVVVGASNLEAFRWQGGVMTGLGGLLGVCTDSCATGVSDDGSIVVGYVSSKTGIEAFLWENDTVAHLGDLPGGNSNSIATNISANGSVIVGFSESTLGIEAFRWEDGVMTGLGDFAGGGGSSWSQAYDVSADGSIVVGYGISDLGHEPFRWENGIMTSLGDLAGGWFPGHAYSVSADGSVIVGESFSISGDEAFIWTVDDGMLSIEDMLINNYGLDITGWTLLCAAGISADGLTIAGYGINPDGYHEAWIATVPEPATFLLLGLSAPLLRRRR